MKHPKKASAMRPALANDVTDPGGQESGDVSGASAGAVVILVATALAIAMVAVPWLSLSWPGLVSGQMSWAASPYGFQAILVAHLLGLAPLVLWLASWLVRWARATAGVLRREHRGASRSPVERASSRHFTAGRLLLVFLWISLALGLAFVSAISLAGGTEAASGDGLRKYLSRLEWVFVLELPWAVALLACVPWRRWWFRPTAIDGVIAVLVALLPVAHVGQVVQREERLLGEALAHAQYAEARELDERLVMVGWETIQGRGAAGMREALEQRVAELRKAVAEPLAADATEDARVRRGRDLMSLGQLDEARALLEPLAERSPEASLYLGAVAEVAGRWPEAAVAYRQTIDLVKQQGAVTDASQRWLRAAYERYANNLRRAGEPLEAERQLKQGMEEWPELRELFLLQLGYHYQMAGRVWESRDFFEQAAAANPALAAEVRVELEKLRNEAQGCLLRPTRGVSR